MGLALISPYDPAAGFNVGHAMHRNKIIYALADAALVVTSDFEKGGTWAGAIEQLKKLRFVPVFLRSGDQAGKSNAALLQQGALPWADPSNIEEFYQALASAAAEPKQETLSLGLRESAPAYDSGSEIQSSLPVISAPDARDEAVGLAASEELLRTVREILRRELAEARTETQVAALLGVAKSQAKHWLARLTNEGSLEKVTKPKPLRYRTASSSDQLL